MDSISTREAYGMALAEIAKKNKRVVVLDAEVGNSTYAENVKKILPERFIEAFVAEQNMIGMSLGLSKKGFDVYASTFAAFLTRAHDQLRMAAVSQGNFTICGSHCGVSVGEDGVSQMGLEDIALFRTIPNSIVFYPSDYFSTIKILSSCSKLNGIKYIRTTRPKTPILYNEKENFPVGKFKVVSKSDKDGAVIAAAGITLHEAIRAHNILKKEKINTCIIDIYCIKPFDINDFLEFVSRHGSKLIVVEDHYREGGIGEMLLSQTNFPSIHLCVKEIPRSGKAEELLKKYEIGSEAIIGAVKKIIK